MHPYLPTGALAIDLALGGGLPAAGISEISGPSGSGKTTLLLNLAAQAQQLGHSVAWIDAGGDLEPAYAVRCGIDPGNLYVASTPNPVLVIDLLENLARSGAFGLVILDSLDPLLPGDAAPAGETGRISLALRRLCEAGLQTALAIARGGIPERGPLYHGLAQEPQRLALKLHAAVRLRLQTDGEITINRCNAGCHVHAKVLKDLRPAKDLPCRGTPGFDIMYGLGIVSAGEAFTLGLQLGLITWHPAGAYVYQGAALGAGQSECLERLRRKPGLCAALEQAIRRKLFHQLDPAVESVSAGPSAATV